MNREHFGQIGDVRVNLVAEIRHGYCEVGCVLRRHFSKGR